MADYYTQAASVFDVESARETEALLDKLRKHIGYIYQEDGADTRPRFPYKDQAVVDVVSEIVDQADLEYIESLHVSLEAFEVTPEDYLYVGTENLEAGPTADLLRILIQIEPEGIVWKMPYAFTCSKLRPDGFSGGIVVVNRESAQVWDVENLFDDMRKLATADDRVVPN